MVGRLSQYKWSSYRAYAYGDREFKWLEKDLIHSFVDHKDPNRSYRNIVQEYAGEEHRFFEDIHWGIVIGTVEFAKKIKNRFKPQEPHSEVPLQKTNVSELDIESMLNQAADLLGCDTENFKKSGRISQRDKMNRDLLLCLFWETGAFTNKEIGRYFGMTYSGVSRRIGIRGSQLSKDCEFKHKFDEISALIKM